MLAVIVIIIVAIIIFCVSSAKGSTSKNKTTTRYDKSGNWMDFDIGKDENKVGNPKYPKAGQDSVMKHEFMDDIMNKK